MKRKPAGKGDKKRFSRGVRKTHKRNLSIPRGGYRL